MTFEASCTYSTEPELNLCFNCPYLDTHLLSAVLSGSCSVRYRRSNILYLDNPVFSCMTFIFWVIYEVIISKTQTNVSAAVCMGIIKQHFHQVQFSLVQNAIFSLDFHCQNRNLDFTLNFSFSPRA